MQKIISLFQRNYGGDHQVRNEVVPGAEWVLAGEGVATRKWDGACCKIEGGELYKRYELKAGKQVPAGFTPAQEPDPVTGNQPGWVKVSDTAPEDEWFRVGFASSKEWHDGTYELVGPRVNGNKDNFRYHDLVPHGEIEIENAPRSFDELKAWFADKDIEGIVWHHPDGRMVKIKKRDFGYKW